MRRSMVLFSILMTCITVCRAFPEIIINEEIISNLNDNYFKNYENIDKILRVEFKNGEIKSFENDAFKDLTALESLVIYNTSVESVQFSIKKLKYLNISKSKLKSAPNLKLFPSLVYLNLVDNNIEDINYHLDHGLEYLNLSENPLRKLDIALKNLTEITIINLRYSEVKFTINCPSLNCIDVSEVNITSNDVDKICKYNSPTIYMNFEEVTIMHECSSSIEEEDENWTDDLVNSNSLGTLDEQSGKIYTQLKDFTEEYNHDSLSKFFGYFHRKVGLSPIYLGILISLVLIILILFSIILIKIRRNNLSNPSYQTHIYEKIVENSSLYLSPPKINFNLK